MGNKGYGSIPGTLFECITFLARALPVRSVPTFIELLIGAMLTQTGFVTGAWLAIRPRRSWSAYYKWLQEGKWSWVALGVQMARMVVTFFPQLVWFLIIDDTFVYRASRKAPGSGIYHQHGNKANRPQYARGQCWVSMALSVTRGKKHSAIPLLSRLMRTDGNTGKLDAAKVLLRTVARVFTGKKVCLLVDSWYMKYPLIAFVLALGFQVIGQVRRDTALYALPVATGKRGRPAKYGAKYTPDEVALLPEVRHWLFLYGNWQWVRYRSAVCLAKFLRGHRVRAVWMQFEDEDGELSKPRLLISTNSQLSADEVFKFYARRWAIEDLFNQMKNGWGWREAWQQSRQVLHRSLDSDPFGRLCPAATAEHVLQRADARTAATDAMAEKGPGDRRPDSLGTTDVFQPCPGSGLVEPDMPKIRTRFTPWEIGQYCRFRKKLQETERKEQ